MIDLHVHSTFSDGSLTPSELVKLALSIDLKALALTDHDTVDGIPALLSAVKEQGARFTVVPGVEVSAEVSKGTLHMLGYFIDHTNPGLKETLGRICGGRDDRNRQIIEKLQEIGLDLTLADAEQYAGEAVVGRPHIAQALMAKGYVSTFREAFDRYLAKLKPAYVDRFRLLPADCISMIRAAGGVPVLSHPFTLDLGKDELKQYVGELAGMGLEGIEVYYSEHSKGRVEQYLSLAQDYDLIATGGTDFHGSINPKVQLGKGFGRLHVADSLLDDLQNRREKLFG